MAVKPIITRKKHHQATAKKIIMLGLPMLMSLIAVTAILKWHYNNGSSALDSIVGFHGHLFSEQDTENGDALLDAVGEKLITHAIAAR